jgi:hypothetical protein
MRVREFGARLNHPPLWATLLVCAVVLFLRRPDLFRAPQFWAEDGGVFFLQARTLGWSALFTPSAGYLHTVLRIVAWIGAQTDPTIVPAWYVIAAGALTLYVAARTQSARFPFKPSVAYALAVVLVPDAFEVLLNLTNLQWILAGGLVLLLISREPQNLLQRIHDAVALVLLGLTGPFVIAVAPLFVWRGLKSRTRFQLGMATGAVACAALQAATIIRSGHEVTKSPVATELILAIPGVRIASSLLFGGHIAANAGVLIATLLGIGTLAGVGWLAICRGPAASERRWLAIAFFVFLAIALFRCRFVFPVLFLGEGSRYFYPLQLIGLWLMIAAANPDSKWQSRIMRLCLAAFVVSNFSRWREPAFTDFNWAYYAAKIRSGETVEVRTNPNWAFEVKSSAALAGPLPDSAASLVNISARWHVTPDTPAIAGFAVNPGSQRRFLIRAVGPSLARFGIKRPLPRPQLRLLLGNREVEGFNVSFDAASDVAIAEATRSCRAFELVPGCADAVALVDLTAGVYNVTISSADDAGGEVLLEIYAVPIRP